MKTEPRPPEVVRDPPRAARVGLVAGLVGISCCVAPVFLVVLGVVTAAEAIDLGNMLFGEWGWAFRIAGGSVAVTGIVIQLRRRGQCSIQGARRNTRFLVRVALIAIATYWILYGITTLLAAWGS